MPKGIKQPDGTTCYTGVNCRRHGQYNFFHGENATPNLMKKKTQKLNPPPIEVEPTVLVYPENSVVTSVVEYDYDWYGCVGNDYESTICRCAEYEGLRITEIDAVSTATALLGARQELLPQDLLDQLDDIGLNDPEYYEIFSENGYYGQEAVVLVDSEVMKRLQQWYYTQENANDPAGILNYVRSKGQPTKNLTPIEAIKTQLRKENEGILNRIVEETKEATVTKLNLDSVEPQNKTHYLKSDPRPPVPANDKTLPILGVVVKEPGSDKYTLVDGNHRVQFARLNRTREGNFIVLS